MQKELKLRLGKLVSGMSRFLNIFPITTASFKITMDTKGLHGLNQQGYFIEGKSMRAC